MKKVEIPTMILRYEGELDFKDLYSKITSWLWKRNYDVFEKNWKEKDATPVGREIAIKLTPDRKVTEYIRYYYTIRWKLMDVHSVGDEKIFARFWMRIEPYFEVDWQNLGKQQRWYERFYEGWLVQYELDDVYEAELAEEAQELLDMIKDELEMDL